MTALGCALAVGLVALAGGSASAAPLLIEHVHGYTLTGEGLRRFDALGLEDGKVLATGEAATLAAQYPHARHIDGRGRTLLPGLIDAHGHVLDLGFQSVRLGLAGSPSLQAAQASIRRYGLAHPRLAWLQGGGWNQVLWQTGRFPTAAELDAAVADRPVILERIDGHAVWVNSAALKKAGITRDTADPPGGRIERDAAGNPNGVLVDHAMDLAFKVVPPPTDDERRAALLAALTALNAVGLTAVGDAGVGPEDLALYRQAADARRLHVRIYAMIIESGQNFDTLLPAGPLAGYGEDHLDIRAVKLVADGALGSRGAAMLTPYADAPGQRGLLRYTDAVLEAKVAQALKAGFQVNVHAIGDAANRQVLNAFERAYAASGGENLRNRIEHAQIVAVDDIPRFKTLDLIASMQPTHATSDMNMAEARVGAARLKGAYAWRTFLTQGTRIAGGSDFPVESPNPFFGLYSAVTRQDHAGQPPGGWVPEQALTLTEALRAFTLDAAYAEHHEQTLGSLEAGKWADFILVDRDLFSIPPSDIWRTQVLETWVGGRRVYARAAH